MRNYLFQFLIRKRIRCYEPREFRGNQLTSIIFILKYFRTQLKYLKYLKLDSFSIHWPQDGEHPCHFTNGSNLVSDHFLT